MKNYAFYLNNELKIRGTKEEIYEICNKENCLCKSDFDEADKKGSFSYCSNGSCVLKREDTKI